MKNIEYLLNYSELETGEIKKTINDFPEEIKWMTDVFLLIQKFEYTLKNIQDLNLRTSVDLAFLATKDIHLCFLSMLRKHTASAYTNMRAALEAATFMNAIGNDNKKSLDWIKKKFLDQNDKDFKKLLKEGREGILGEELRQRFNTASEQSHSNMFRLLLWKTQKLDIENKIINHKYSFFDESDSWFISNMHHQIGSAFLILSVIDIVFKKHLTDSGFKQKLEAKKSEYRKYLSENLDRILLLHKLEN